jgi:hypothetical protein
MNCPTCNAALGEGATACAACGWKKSGSKIWLWILVIVGALFLICAGIATWGFFKVKGFMGDMTPVMLRGYKLQVLTHAKAHGGELPASLAEVRGGVTVPQGGGQMTVDGNDGQFRDGYMNPVRYTKNADGTFELRSGGPDGVMDNADDSVVAGSVKDSLKVVELEIQLETQRMARNVTVKMAGENNPEIQKIDAVIAQLEKQIAEAKAAGDEEEGGEDGNEPGDGMEGEDGDGTGEGEGDGGSGGGEKDE